MAGIRDVMSVISESLQKNAAKNKGVNGVNIHMLEIKLKKELRYG